ncbi:hypothetical protein SAMN02910384_02003 [Pseudobutyrivibrio sp. ACV-2]|uniref:hypothetical protein n=1 Tax=Pseudobutyrivibrio sp. ACV-2 TaxID=1520801 RepID=UPI00089BCFC7|nr:hypothetical protein [Pseudobutyrivibrio sp. ACV-2]SEA65323.1 hypothetical protein SAMN02910384_02003 [Pseudobutyrivibrio sp. ACV-2]
MENINVEQVQLDDDVMVSNAEKPEYEQQAPAMNVTSIEFDNGEDLLLEQIDAFRDKATQLSQLIAAKEQKAAELEALVREKEAINIKLQEELNRKQEEADNLVADVETQVDRMMQVVKNNMDQLELDIKGQVSDNQESYETHNRNLQDTLRNVSAGLDTIQNELSEKTHSESVHLYRMIQELLKEHDNSEEQAVKALEHYSSLKKLSVVVIVLLAASLGVGIVSLLISLGVI